MVSNCVVICFEQSEKIERIIIKSGWSHVVTVRRFIQGQFTCAGCYGNEIDRSLAFNIHSDPFNWLYNQMFL